MGTWIQNLNAPMERLKWPNAQLASGVVRSTTTPKLADPTF